MVCTTLTVTAPISTGSIYCTSVPSGAAIYLDLANTGKVTPATLTNLAAPNTYLVEYKRVGYKTCSGAIGVLAGQTTNAPCNLVIIAPEITVFLSDYGFAKYDKTTKVTSYIDTDCKVDQSTIANSFIAFMYTIEVTGGPVKSFDVEFKWTDPNEPTPYTSKQSHIAFPVGIHPDQVFILGGLVYVSGTYTITQASLKNIVAA